MNLTTEELNYIRLQLNVKKRDLVEKRREAYFEFLDARDSAKENLWKVITESYIRELGLADSILRKMGEGK